jgi:predicted enzyme related to lactoylglutathione lyase
MLDVSSVTFTITAPDVDRARDWYASALGRPPDIAPDAGVYEWQLVAGAWLQLGAAEPGEEPGTGAVLRFGVADLDAALTALAAAGAEVGNVERIPGVIAFCDVEDPFGNVLSLYQELGEG